MKAVYKCLDFDIVDSVLIIWDAELIGMVKTSEDFNELINGNIYNGVVCPEIYCNANGVTKVLFK